MPIYEYVPDSGQCNQCNGKFEIMQKLGDPQLTQCPTCDQACHRVFSAFAVSQGNILSQQNLESKGFTQYKKAGDGYYEKTAGKEGPDVIKR